MHMSAIKRSAYLIARVMIVSRRPLMVARFVFRLFYLFDLHLMLPVVHFAFSVNIVCAVGPAQQVILENEKRLKDLLKG